MLRTRRSTGPIVQLRGVDDATLKRWRDQGLLKGRRLTLRVTQEMVERGTRASWHGPPAFDDLPEVVKTGRAEMVRDILNAALGGGS